MHSLGFTIGSSLVLAVLASLAQAQVQRTFVSGLGNDSNPCARTAPCRTFTQAISQTNSGGEVIVLDSAGYGAFSIAKPVSIISPPGVYAGISVFSADGIDINAGVSDTVILRGLTVNNQGSTGTGGIVFNSGGILHVENCVVNGFTAGSGLAFLGSGSLEVKDSIMRLNNTGIFVAPSSGTVQATIDHVRLEGGGFGLVAMEGSVVAVRNSVASANGAHGFLALSNTAASVRLNLEGCIASNNVQFGIFSKSTSTGSVDVDVEGCVASGDQLGIGSESSSTGVATVRLSNSTVTGNGTGIQNFASPALFQSRGNNTVEGNTTNTLGTIGSYSPK
jgi:hypothetical protein